jgi:hypothetical protein
MERREEKWIVAPPRYIDWVGQIGILPLFDMLRLVLSAFPLRLCAPLKGVLKRIFAVKI